METSRKAELIEKIAERRARVGVVGLGYVGLPLAVEFAGVGFDVTGFEVSGEKVEQINGGRSYIQDVESDLLAPLVEAKRLRATEDFSKLDECDAIIVCVPTPLNKTKEPDISYILAAVEKIRATLRPGQLIVLESTTYPGTTDEVLLPSFREQGLELDRDFFLAFSPERVDPGNPQFQTRNITKVVGGVTAASTEVAATLYGAVIEKVHRVSSARVAETAKLLENTFRAVNIGLVNEIAQLCYQLDIDTWEVIRAAATKPFGFMPFYPGPGIGGHCLVGTETAVVRERGSNRGHVARLNDLFERESADARVRKFPAGGGEVIYKPRLEALSVDMDTKHPTFKPVRYLFRRKYDGPVVTIATTDNRRLTVTDQHPMLVCGPEGRLRETFARDLVPGDRIPIHQSLESESIDIQELAAGIATVPVESVSVAKLGDPVNVYSLEVDDTHTFATSYGIYVHNCIPLDPHYLSWKARLHGFEARFIGLAEEVNSRMPQHVLNLVTEGLNRHRKAVNGARVLVLGVAYKKDIDDVRESPALAVIDQLIHRGAEVVYHDPFVPELRLDTEHASAHDVAPAGGTLESIELSDDELGRADCVVVVTDHSDVDYARVIRLAQLVVDTRNVSAGLVDADAAGKVIRL